MMSCLRLVPCTVSVCVQVMLFQIIIIMTTVLAGHSYQYAIPACVYLQCTCM